MSAALKLFEPVLRAPESQALLAFMQSVEADLARVAEGQTGFLAKLLDYVLTGSGKRLRPALVQVSAQFGKAKPESVKQVALAVELIHIATLVHDDIVDDAAIRRRKPTVHAKYGDGTAVLLGDFVYAQAFQRLAALDAPYLLKLFSNTTMVMCEGEIEQVEQRHCFDLDEARYMTFLEKKTAALMSASCRAGASLAGLPEDQQEALESFGRQLGLAFQVVDDILDLEGEEAVTGKTLRTDLVHGKMTLPLIHYRETLKSSDKPAFFAHLKNPNGQIADLIRRVHEAGSMEYSRKKANELLNSALESLNRLPDVPSRRLLTDIAQRLSDRKV